MARAYIAAPFTCKMSDKRHGLYGEITDTDYKSFLEAIENIIKSLGISTFLPHRDIGKWGSIPNMSLDYTTKRYFEEIDDSYIFIAYPEKSGGVRIELGWALATNKKIILLLPEGFDMGTVI